MCWILQGWKPCLLSPDWCVLVC
eukprot:jgi/Chrzof1/10427/UNPLg00354.t1